MLPTCYLVACHMLPPCMCNYLCQLWAPPAPQGQATVTLCAGKNRAMCDQVRFNHAQLTPYVCEITRVSALAWVLQEDTFVRMRN